MDSTENYSSYQKASLVSILQQKNSLLQQKEALILEQERELEKLRTQIVNANKSLYGPKSEKLSVLEQGQLFPVEGEAENELVSENITIPAHTRRVREKRELPLGTEVRRIEYPASVTECECCGAALTQIREEVTKILQFVPARFILEEHVKPVMACSGCKDKAPVTTKLPSGVQIIPRSPAGVSLLTHVLITKYVDHLPLYRQEAQFARLGFSLSRSTMCDWLGGIAEILLPLYQALKREVIRDKYLQADETTVRVQDGEDPGKCHTGYLWGMLSPPPGQNLVYFHYAPSRAGEVPKTVFSEFTGILQTDLYAGYNTVYTPERAVRAGCWAHVRRKFLEVEKLSKAQCGRVLKLIAELYAVDKKGAGREKRAGEILAKLHSFLTEWSANTLPDSKIQSAINYALKQWDALTLFVTNPDIRLDNNLIENQMRPIALGRKNWLFAGSHEGAMRAAIFYSLINSCKLNGIKPDAYFRRVLPVLKETPRQNLAALLPHQYKIASA